MHFPVLVLWACFLIGQMLYVLIRAGYAIRAAKNPVSSRRQFLYIWWDVILCRTVIEIFFFWFYWGYPDILTRVVALAGLNWNLTLPLIPPISFGIGLVSDLFLDNVTSRIPFFQKDLNKLLPHLPPMDGNGDTKV